MIGQGMVIMLSGMAVVFLFLSLMVAVINAMGMIDRRLEAGAGRPGRRKDGKKK
ncbi:MAG: OadG family protein [Negativicutes bacterium]|nr:OadG family protein [Negativicutes bacterium]